MYESATLWSVAYQASLFMRFFRQEYWSGLPFHSPGDLPNPGIDPTPLTSALAGRFFTTSATQIVLEKSTRRFMNLGTLEGRRLELR